ncbi:MAG: DsbA family protein [Patescibacteria group bacterium]
MDNELQDRIRLADMKERHKNKLKPWYKKWWGVTIIILGAITISLVTMAAIYVYQSAQRINADRTALYSGQRPELIKSLIEGQGRPYLGNANSDIVIVEYSDFACPYCKENQPAIKAIMKKYSGQVKMIFRNLILHQDSEYLSLASLCAGEQQKNGSSLFWPMHDQLFNLQGKITETDLPKIATALGADEKTFSACMASKKYLGVLSSDMETASTLQITGSPTWFINNYKIDGVVSEAELESMIKELITNGTGVDQVITTSTSTETKK